MNQQVELSFVNEVPAKCTPTITPLKKSLSYPLATMLAILVGNEALRSNFVHHPKHAGMLLLN